MCAVVHDAGARLSERVTNARAACSVGRQCVCATQMMLDVRAFMLAFGGYVDAVTRYVWGLGFRRDRYTLQTEDAKRTSACRGRC
jgi:hypothetical protein